METSASSSSAPPNTSAAISNQRRMQNIIDNLNKMRAEQRSMAQKVNELESDANEHRLVIDALKVVDPDRNCYRMIGGILIQQTVKDVLPDLEKNHDMLKKTILTYRDNIKTKGVSINEYIQQHNLGPMIRSQNAAAVPVSSPAGDNTSTEEQQKPKDKKTSPSVLVG